MNLDVVIHDYLKTRLADLFGTYNMAVSWPGHHHFRENLQPPTSARTDSRIIWSPLQDLHYGPCYSQKLTTSFASQKLQGRKKISPKSAHSFFVFCGVISEQ